MNHLIRKIWSKLVPSSSEQANQQQLAVKHQPHSDTYFFTHVPKTGGTSFIVFLDRFFPAKVIFPHQLWHEIGDFKQIDRSAYNLIRGHFGGCAVDLISDKHIQYLTIMREPVKLAYSTYEHVRRDKNTALHPLVMAEKMSFETFVSHPKTKHLITDRMVHNLTFGRDYDPTVKTFDFAAEPHHVFRRKMNRGQRELDDAIRLQLAKQFLADALWFGILERFDDSVRLLCYKMAWPPLRKSQKLNINKIKPVITDEARKTALSHNQLDIKLYDHAVTQFDLAYTEMLSELGANQNTAPEAVDDLIDQHYQANYTQRHQMSLAESIEYDFSEVLLGGQWHRREWNALNKSYFRWTGPGNTSFLDFWMLPQDYRIKVIVVDAISSELLDGVQVHINDQAVEVEQSGSGKSRELLINCPAALIDANGLLRLQFKTQELQSHTAYFSSDDHRLVGFAVGGVQIKPA